MCIHVVVRPSLHLLVNLISFNFIKQTALPMQGSRWSLSGTKRPQMWSGRHNSQSDPNTDLRLMAQAPGITLPFDSLIIGPPKCFTQVFLPTSSILFI